NLLPDHLVDDILDSAASHWNTIEREGISISHPADFVLVGTMNPEEGELRPQILDRFSISVNVKTIMDKELRAEIVKRNILFEENPEEFYDIFREEDDKLKEVIISAKEIFPDVEIDNEHIYAVSGACAELKVDGQRPDIVITKTARTIASLKQRDYVNNDDILLAAEFTLMHRTRDGGLLEPPEAEEIRKVFSNYLRSIPKRVVQRESEQKKSDSKDINKETGSLDFVKNIKFKKEVSKSQVGYVSANEKKK
ncbi:magnesium chelatase, partial [candidate division WOR-3 bacterium]|nr:magnesium chelatase [candidate division WOR-3 bacterium]